MVNTLFATSFDEYGRGTEILFHAAVEPLIEKVMAERDESEVLFGVGILVLGIGYININRMKLCHVYEPILFPIITIIITLYSMIVRIIETEDEELLFSNLM